MPGIFVQTIVFAAATTAIGMCDDINKGIIDRFRRCRWPAPPSSPGGRLGRRLQRRHPGRSAGEWSQSLEFGVGIRIQIAAHDIGAAHEEASAFEHPFHRLELVFHVGHEASGGAVVRLHRGVHTDTGAAFGGAIAFEDAHAKAAGPSVGRGFLQLFCARKEQPQARGNRTGWLSARSR